MKKHTLSRLIFRLCTWKWRVMGFLGLQTIGVRVLATDEDKVLLVKHTYTPLWYLPGGGIKRHEAPIDSAKRELFEETGLMAKSLSLLGAYHNPQYGRDDYITLYHVTDFDAVEKSPCHEIKDVKWFPNNNLPQDISPATRSRVEEWRKEKEVSKTW